MFIEKIKLCQTISTQIKQRKTVCTLGEKIIQVAPKNHLIPLWERNRFHLIVGQHDGWMNLIQTILRFLLFNLCSKIHPRTLWERNRNGLHFTVGQQDRWMNLLQTILRFLLIPAARTPGLSPHSLHMSASELLSSSSTHKGRAQVRPWI